MNQSADEHVTDLKQQIADATETMGLNRKLAEDRLQQLSELGARLKMLNDTSLARKGMLAELPKVLQSVMDERDFGIFIVGGNKKILLYNTLVQDILGLRTNPLNEGFTTCLFKEDKITSCNPGDPEWDKLIDCGQMRKLFVKHPKVPDGIWIRLQSTPLLDESGQSAGAVVLLNDVTEQMKIESEIQRICESMNLQLNTIEQAKVELNR